MEQSKQQRIRELTDRLNRCRYEYYNLNAPSLTDAEYDALFDELSALEKETGFSMTNSPTQTVFRRVVGYTPCSKLFGFAGDRDTDLAGPVRNEFRRQGIRTAKKKLYIAVAQNFLPLVIGIAVLKAG